MNEQWKSALEKARLAPRKPKGATPSLRKAINDKCKDCTYDKLSGLGNWRQQITACTVTSCPLHPVRPLSSQKKACQKTLAEA
jgi:hypothetical protein